MSNQNEITPATIKKLRDRTGIGMGKCKEALEEAKGDMELAVANLRKAGIVSAVKKEGRETNEGMIASATNSNIIGIAEVNAETDFVVKNEKFQQFLKQIAEEVASTKPSSLDAFKQQKYSKDRSLTIEEYRATLVQMIGENIQISRIKTFEKAPDQSIGVYSHLGGKILTLVVIKGSSAEEVLAKDIAMHIAAAAPEFLSEKEVPQKVIEQEKEIAKDQIKNKPENIVQTIVNGKINAFYDAVCLTRQKYIRNDALTISELVSQQAKKTGKPLEIVSFLRWQVGQ